MTSGNQMSCTVLLWKPTAGCNKAYLIAVLDDHSRLLPHAEFFLSERLECWLDAFRQALLTRGLPRKLYVDNGAAFSSKHLERICASLGIALVHTPPYTPQGRGKIERFFRTVRTRFLPNFRGGTLLELNIAFDMWQNEYHQRLHSSTGETPFARFASHLEIIRSVPTDLEDHFRKEARRRVAKDRTVSLDVLAGQINLVDNLLYRTAVPLASRIVTRSHFHAVNREAMEDYLNHHLKIAGLENNPFEAAAITAVHQGAG